MYPFKSFRTIIHVKRIAVGHFSGDIKNNTELIISEIEQKEIDILFVLMISFVYCRNEFELKFISFLSLY